MLEEALNHVLNQSVRSFVAKAAGEGFRLQRRLQDVFPRFGQCVLEGLGAEILLAMQRPKQALEPLEQPAPIALHVSIGKLAEKFDVANQVGHAELHQHAALAGIFAVGPIIIAAQNPLEVLPQDAPENLRPTGRGDVEHHKAARPEAPSPVALPVLLVSGFIDVVEVLMRQRIDQLLPRWAEGCAGFAQKFGGVASGNLHTYYVGQKVPDAYMIEDSSDDSSTQCRSDGVIRTTKVRLQIRRIFSNHH